MSYTEELQECAALLNTSEAKRVIGSGETVSARPPAFQPEWLPEPLRSMCEALAANMSVPLDLPACVGLGVASACGCGRIRVNIRDGWTEECQLFMLIVADSGSAKTPVFKKMTDLLFEAQVQENQRRAVQIEQDKASLDVLQAQKADAIRKKDAEKAREIAKEIATFPVRYPVRRFIGSNVTPESFPEIMQENGGATSVLDDEGDMFEQLGGRYQDCPSLDPFLKGYNGSPLESHRRGRAPVVVPRADLSVMILAQPIVVDTAFSNSRFVGKGLLPRFVISRPDPIREYGPEPPIPEKVKRDYRDSVEKMLDIGKHCFTLSPEASRIFFDFRDERRERQFDEWDALRLYGFAGKIESNLARIACALKLWDGVYDDEIKAAQMRNAVAITRYFLAHTLHMLGPAAKLSERARLVLDHLMKSGERVQRERDVKQQLTKTKGFKNSAVADQAITELVENRFITRYSNITGGRPSWFLELLCDGEADII